MSQAILHRIGLDSACVSIRLEAGLIAEITPSGGFPEWQIMPLAVDPHVHLDKSFIWPRARPAAPGLFPAIEATQDDKQFWNAADLYARGERALQEAHLAGATALRSHVDWGEPDTPLAWEVLGDLAASWRGRITLQRAPLVSIDVLGDPAMGPGIAVHVAATGDGVLGAFLYRHREYPEKLARIFRLAAEHGLRLDFHVDEGLEPEAQGFDEIVRLTAAHDMGGLVLCGHACSLSIRPDDEVARLLNDAARAGVALCVLPTTNLWLQDGARGRTPRLRGLAPLQEARAAGVPVLLGADNVADPFYPFGSYDALEILRLACTAAHLDPADWLTSVTTDAARIMGLPAARIERGARADFLLVKGCDWFDALRRPPARRIFRNGQESKDITCP